MSDWIGHLIANWPLWAVVGILILVSIAWILYYLTSSYVDFPFKKKAWWQDIAQQSAEDAKPKNKKGK